MTMVRERRLHMPQIQPFGIHPVDNGVDRFTLYWYSALQHEAYRPFGTTLETLYSLGGADSVTRYALPSFIFPYVDYAVFPGNIALLSIVGTRNWQEFGFQALGAVLVHRDPWPGLVGDYWSNLALALFNLVEAELVSAGITTVALAGHSQGGALAQLFLTLIDELPAVSTACIVTLGSPRSGNVEFGDALQNTRYARLTNQGDPVPALPPSLSPALEQFQVLITGIPVSSYFHFGTRFHLFESGGVTNPQEQPSWLEGSQHLLQSVRGVGTWIASHNPAEYARRLRRKIQVPMQTESAEYPGLKELDDYFAGEMLPIPATTWLNPVDCPV